jgi:hypothetical protein
MSVERAAEICFLIRSTNDLVQCVGLPGVTTELEAVT